MKIKKKVKRISSVVLCFLMLLTTLPMTAITANAAAQAYIKYIDTEVYIGDVLNIIVGVNGGSTDETFTYQWQAKYPSLSWVNLSDKTDRPDSKFSGVFTDHLKFQTYAELVGPGSGWKDVVFRCKVTGSKSGTFYSGKCNFPGLLEKTEIPTIGFLGLEKPEQGKIPSTTATPINSTYYSFDYIEWYKYENNKISRKLDSGETFDSGMYCCQLYFNMNRGYAVAKNAVCGLYNGDSQATILQDETTGQYYIWAYYNVPYESPSFTHQFPEAEIMIMKGKEEIIWVAAKNATLYYYQTGTGKYVITVSKPQCVTRVYEVNVDKKDVNLDVNITVPYDVNMDGVINVVDATLVQKYIVGLEEFDDYTFKIADTNGDGTISIIDATNIQKKIVNLL